MERCCSCFESPATRTDKKKHGRDSKMPVSSENNGEKDFTGRGSAADFSGRLEPVVPISASAQPLPSNDADLLPTFDLSDYLESQHDSMQSFCCSVAQCLAQTGCLIVRDPRVGSAQSDTFLDMMERYFSQPDEDKMADVHPELHYQVQQCFCETHRLPWLNEAILLFRCASKAKSQGNLWLCGCSSVEQRQLPSDFPL